MEKKMTIKEFYENVINGDITDEVMEIAKAQLSKLNARSAKSSEARAKANAEIAEKIMQVITDTPKGAGEIAKALNNEYTTQKISAVLGKMVADGLLIINEIKIKGRKVNGYSDKASDTDDINISDDVENSEE